jgi:hypothetical protein
MSGDMEPRTAEGRKLLAERDFHQPSCPRWFAVSEPDAACDCLLPSFVWAVEQAAAEAAFVVIRVDR